MLPRASARSSRFRTGAVRSGPSWTARDEEARARPACASKWGAKTSSQSGASLAAFTTAARLTMRPPGKPHRRGGSVQTDRKVSSPVPRPREFLGKRLTQRSGSVPSRIPEEPCGAMAAVVPARIINDGIQTDPFNRDAGSPSRGNLMTDDPQPCRAQVTLDPGLGRQTAAAGTAHRRRAGVRRRDDTAGGQPQSAGHHQSTGCEGNS